MLIQSVFQPIFNSSFSPLNGSALRSVLIFDGLNDYGVFGSRVIDPDGNVDLQFYAPSSLAVARCVLSQNILLGVNSEFRLMSTATGLSFTLGGATLQVLTIAEGYTVDSKYRIQLIGTSMFIWKDVLTGTPLKTLTFNRGAMREPTAVAVLGARTSGSLGTYDQYFVGKQSDVMINGTLWSISDRDKTIQPSTPNGNNLTLFNTAGSWVDVPL